MSLPLRVCLLFLLFYTQLSWGQSNFSLQPIVGYERVYHSSPQEYWRTRTTYGARLLLGPQLLSLDLEYTEDENDFGATSVENDTKRIKAGLRSTFNFSSYIGTFVRAGVQWKDETHTETTGGVPTVTKVKSTDPYAGAGLVVAYASNLALTADVTAVFIEQDPSGNSVEFQYTAGLVVKIGK